MEPFRTSGFGYGAPIAPPPSPTGPQPAPASTNPRLAQLQQFLASQPPEFIANLRNAIQNAPPAQQGQILQQAFSSIPGGMEAISGAADEVRAQKNGGGSPPINPNGQPGGNPGADNAPPTIGPAAGGTEAPVPAPPPVVQPVPGTDRQPIGDFDFSPYAGQPDAYSSAGFKKGWDETMQAWGQLTPEQRAVADAYLKENSTGVKPGEARGMNLMRKAARVAMGAEPGATQAGTNPPPPGTTAAADEPALQGQSNSFATDGSPTMKPRPGTNPRTVPPATATTGPGLQGRAAVGGRGVTTSGTNPRPTTGPGLQGRPRPGTNPRPTLPNESNQARPQPGVNPRRRRPEPTGY